MLAATYQKATIRIEDLVKRNAKLKEQVTRNQRTIRNREGRIGNLLKEVKELQAQLCTAAETKTAEKKRRAVDSIEAEGAKRPCLTAPAVYLDDTESPDDDDVHVVWTYTESENDCQKLPSYSNLGVFYSGEKARARAFEHAENSGWHKTFVPRSDLLLEPSTTYVIS